MSRASRARRIAAAAAYGGGGLTALGATGLGVLALEAKMARRWIGQPFEQAPSADGTYGRGRGRPWRLAVLGDSSAAGLGADRPEETPGALIAAGLAEASDRPVRLHCAAVVGAESRDLAPQVDAVLAGGVPDVVVVMVGANDVTHRIRPSDAVRALVEAVVRMRDAGAEVVVGTCPDLGTIEPVRQPLRLVARRLSRQLAAAQTVAVVEAGGRTVSLADLLGPEFSARPRELFSSDRFHPSPAGYARLAAALLPSVLAAVGVEPEGLDEVALDERRGEGVGPLPQAAVVAADSAGTEVAPARLGGVVRGPLGRWAVLLHRRWRPPAEVVAAEEDADARVEALPAQPDRSAEGAATHE